MKIKNLILLIILSVISEVYSSPVKSQSLKENPALDEKVRKFLAENPQQWQDMNVPSVDGQLLYDIIIKNKYKAALEIGTSTGHSGIWIAWALSKTGGKLITIDIDEGRHRRAVENFKKAGLSEYIDARLADAHELVKELKGPFYFVFSDADKEWYKNYFIDVDPKLKVGDALQLLILATDLMVALEVLEDQVEGEAEEVTDQQEDKEHSLIILKALAATKQQ